MGEKRKACRLFVGKPEGKRPLARQRRRWVDIKLDLGEIGWDGMNWIGLAQDKEHWRVFLHMEMNLRVP
jgi:hypothetical protein